MIRIYVGSQGVKEKNNSWHPTINTHFEVPVWKPSETQTWKMKKLVFWNLIHKSQRTVCVCVFFFSFWPRKECRSLSLFIGRRFTIEVLPNFTLTPHFKSFPPHPKTGFSKAHIASRWIIPWPKYTKKIIFRNKIRLATILGSGAPLFRNRFSGKVSPLA